MHIIIADKACTYYTAVVRETVLCKQAKTCIDPLHGNFQEVGIRQSKT